MKQITNEQKEFVIFLSITILIVAVFSFVLFRITGLRIVVGIIFISLPFYLILNNFGLAEGEKFVFSILLGLTIFPSLVYILGLIVSFRIAIIATFIVFISIAIALISYKSKKSRS